VNRHERAINRAERATKWRIERPACSRALARDGRAAFALDSLAPHR
jgi:hypothetical protein